MDEKNYEKGRSMENYVMLLFYYFPSVFALLFRYLIQYIKKINVASRVARKFTLFEWTGVVNDCKIVK